MHMDYVLREELLEHRENPQVTFIIHSPIHLLKYTHTHIYL